MRIEIIKCLQDNYSYLIIDKITNDACVVDPSEAKPIIDYVEKNNIKLKYILNMQGSNRVTLGSDYPFPLGDLEIGEFINEMDLEKSVVEDIFCNSTLQWLNLDKSQFT